MGCNSLMLTFLPRHSCVPLLYSLPKFTNHVKELHAQLITNGIKSPSLLAKLIEHYCESPFKHVANNAHLVFRHFDKPDLFLFNTLIRCVQPEESITTFQNEFSRGAMVFNDYTYNFVLGACARSPLVSSLWLGRQLHALIVKHGIESDILVQTTKIHFYASHKDIKSARRMFDEMPERSVVTWNAMITGYCSMKEGNEDHAAAALSLFCNMVVDPSGVKPTDTTIVCVLSAASQMGIIDIGACIHGFVGKTGYSPEYDVFIGTGMVDMYAKCGCLNSALSVFWQMNVKNVLTWTAMTTGLAIHGKGRQALEIFYKMGAYGVKPNEATFASLFSACCHARLVEEGLQLFHDMKRVFGVTPRIQHYGCIVDLLGRAGQLTEAYDFALGMPISPDSVIWRSLLAACKIHGDIVMGEKVGKFLLQLKEETCPNVTSTSEDYVALSNVYASAERWNDVETIRKGMKARSVWNRSGSSSVQTVNMATL
ncbi:pentatricopeptide repeat-containing protein At3g18970 [Arachis stenosperma]|uniref:pentatricopeptide repeat-containing protein At3g18970 n=1 Tax=Arachis stenosperma TaxID=217475 RepID=UPI0025AC77DF|nr:pentatricopeptide repeat-containing protein At3g18970 [Arachis stenosperma]XP_057742971.1 pentatricopeptide repeat-containing protein At3g18970 [Arachis stenosperma]